MRTWPARCGCPRARRGRCCTPPPRSRRGSRPRSALMGERQITRPVRAAVGRGDHASARSRRRARSRSRCCRRRRGRRWPSSPPPCAARCSRRIRARPRSSIATRSRSGGWSSPRATTAPPSCGPLLPADAGRRAAGPHPAARRFAGRACDQRTADQRRADALLQPRAPAGRGGVVEAGRQRHRRPVHPARSGRAARRAGRARTDPGRAGPGHRRRPHRHLAAAGDRRARQPGRRLLRHLPATRRDGPLRRSPRRHLLPPGLPAQAADSCDLDHTIDWALGGTHLPGQPHAVVQPAPPPQTQRRLAVCAASRTTPSAGPPPPATPTTDHHRTHSPSTPRWARKKSITGPPDTKIDDDRPPPF